MEALSFVVILIYAVFFGIVAIISLVPAVINGIGLARICKKFDTFSPVWRWVWSLLVPVVAVLRVGDAAAKRENPYSSRKLFKVGILAFIVFTVLATLTTIFAAVFSVSAEAGFSGVLNTISMIGLFILFIPTLLAAIWMAIPLYISYFRIFKAFLPTWGAWLTLIGMFVLSEFAFLIMPVLSFFPLHGQEQKDEVQFE